MVQIPSPPRPLPHGGRGDGPHGQRGKRCTESGRERAVPFTESRPCCLPWAPTAPAAPRGEPVPARPKGPRGLGERSEPHPPDPRPKAQLIGRNRRDCGRSAPPIRSGPKQGLTGDRYPSGRMVRARRAP